MTIVCAKCGNQQGPESDACEGCGFVFSSSDNYRVVPTTPAPPVAGRGDIEMKVTRDPLYPSAHAPQGEASDVASMAEAVAFKASVQDLVEGIAAVYADQPRHRRAMLRLLVEEARRGLGFKW